MASENALRAIGRVGQSVNLAMERFVAVADKIGDDNPDIKQDMYDACKEARTAGEMVCKGVAGGGEVDVSKQGFTVWYLTFRWTEEYGNRERKMDGKFRKGDRKAIINLSFL